MSAGYRAVSWMPHKKAYDLVLAAACVSFVVIFVGVGMAAYRPPNDISVPILVLRALGTLALVLLHITLAIGPIARLWPRTGFLLANRRHLGVTTFLVAGAHALLVYGFYGGFGVQNPILAVLVRPDGGVGFEFLGFVALLILLVMAATSHDFWLAFLGHRVWKAMHMAVYAAYALVVAHVAFGVMQSELSPMYPALLALGALTLGTLHIAAGTREWRRDATTPTTADDGWVDIGEPTSIPDKRARVVCLGRGERVAVFRDGDSLSALSNVCAHQGGPLGEGEIIDGCATCPWHGYQYETSNGQSPPPFTEKIPTYELRVRGGRVEVNPKPNAPGTPTTPITIPNGTNP
jgi:DMSO/TMAO reductase YedYZ heme-binding membrane subunit/nitrite reductase/ring-hydroxylating ferredoxin subunit